MKTNDVNPELERLFVLELKYKRPIELAPLGDKVGKLVGGGKPRCASFAHIIPLSD